jgi:DNA-binding helix-hairpin-helix protein with protein kinase domain
MTLRGLHNEQYHTLRELGRGGEGTVYDIQDHSSLVLKKYNEPLAQDKAYKLRHMVDMRSPAIEAYAAWPTDLAHDNTGTVCGFVMRKLTGYVPLHMLFSPMDRKKLFPDKGYNFLVHVARNLSTAFFKLHEAGLVAGDVNEGNVLINSSGMVAFIDCDSFQVKGADKYFFCEVGVPRYTPPELLSKGSFENIVRTVNTDSFSLAVLIFQLLFLGRHPFAGKNKLAADFDEETAIRKHEFAYSLENKKKKLYPPPDSFPITNLSAELVTLLHRAFEQDARPTPAEWAKALDAQLADMVTCNESRLHTYPSKMAECPWCYYKKSRGILYFLDDSYLHATAVLGDIESFVNGFHLEKMELKKWSGPLTHPGLIPAPIEQKFRSAKTTNNLVALCFVVAGVLLYFILHVNFIVMPVALVLCFVIKKYSPWAREINTGRMLRIAVWLRLQQNLVAMIAEHDNSADAAKYTNALSGLNKLVHDFRGLPNEFERRKKIMEERVFNEQLDDYLLQFNIERHAMPLFGTAKKTALYNNGIKSAADITKLQTLKVPGIGPKNLQTLLSWRRQLSSGFVYIPDNDKLLAGMGQVNMEVGNIKTNLEAQIRKEYQALNYLKLNINNRALVLERQINDLVLKTNQAEADMQAFRKFAA